MSVKDSKGELTKTDKIKICRYFTKINTVRSIYHYGILGLRESPGWEISQIEDAIRWGLKHPEELTKKVK